LKIDWSKFESDTAPATPSVRAVLPHGEHVGVIERVVEQPGWRVDERNPSGDCLSIWIDVNEGSGNHRIFHTVASNWTSKLIEIARCAGVAPPERGQDDWDEQTLVGASVRFESGSYIVQNGPKAGEERAKVVKFLDQSKTQSKPADADRAPRQTMKQKTHAEWKEKNGDDIPF
jgi:hypothetical protein